MHLSTSAFADLGDRFQMRWVGPILMAVSVVGFVIAGLGIAENRAFLSDDVVRTTGVSIRHELYKRSSSASDRQTDNVACWLPVIEFEAVSMGASETRMFRASDCEWNVYDNPVGTSYPVEYLRSDPSRARVVSTVGNWMTTIVGGALGLGFLLVGGVLWGALRDERE